MTNSAPSPSPGTKPGIAPRSPSTANTPTARPRRRRAIAQCHQRSGGQASASSPMSSAARTSTSPRYWRPTPSCLVSSPPIVRSAQLGTWASTCRRAAGIFRALLTFPWAGRFAGRAALALEANGCSLPASHARALVSRERPELAASRGEESEVPRMIAPEPPSARSPTAVALTMPIARSGSVANSLVAVITLVTGYRQTDSRTPECPVRHTVLYWVAFVMEKQPGALWASPKRGGLLIVA